MDTGLAHLAMEGATAQEGVILHLFQSTWSVEAFFVARGCVAGSGLSFSLCFRAFEDDDVACHGLIGKK